MTRADRAFIAGSRSFIWHSTGVATKIEEYVPTAVPMNSTSARSFKAPAPSRKAPTNRIDATGNSATMLVLIDRMMVWLSARFANSLYV